MDQKIIELTQGWKFHYGDVPEAWYKGYDDREWEDIFLPHDWSVHMPFSKEYSSGTGYLAGGIGWYRLRFQIPKEYEGKCVRLVFDGIYKNSRIWCNSYHLGKRPYGYSEISYDITEFANFGEEDNEVSVQVTRMDLADSRWFTGSGIYRKAYLVVEEEVHPMLHGTFFRTLSLDENGANVEISTELYNASAQNCWINASYTLIDQDGNTAAIFKKGARLKSGEDHEIRLAGRVENPRLWSIEEPHLYTLVTEFSYAGGEFWRAETDQVGIRNIVFDANRGLFLNGRETKLKGVCVHHDGGCLGAAMYKAVWRRRLEKLKELGCNAIRCSHNPHMPELYELCDEMGFVMMDEAFDEWENPKNKWSTGHNVYPPKHQGYAEDFPQWYEADLTAMIKRDRNHPSVIMWSIGNEIDYPNDPYCHPYFDTMTGNNDANKPAAERMYDKNKPNANRLSKIAAKLSAIVRKLDASRPVTLAAAFPELSSRIGFLDSLDVVGYNYKEHLYEEDHKRFPDKPFLGSENGHGYLQWRAVTDNPYISGQFLWTGIDYLGEAHGWPVRGSGAGIIDIAGNEKPGYYRRKAFWSQKPYACLLTAKAEEGESGEWIPYQRSWNYKEGETVLIRSFSNLKTAEVSLNGKTLGEGSWRKELGCYEWKTSFEAGVLSLISRNESGSEEVTDCLETTKKAADISYKIWKSPVEAENSEIIQLELTLVDEDKKSVTDDDKLIEASVENGTLLGLESGDIADVTSYAESFRKTHQGRLIVYVRPNENEKVSLTLNCKKLGWSQTILV